LQLKPDPLSGEKEMGIRPACILVIFVACACVSTREQVLHGIVLRGQQPVAHQYFIIASDHGACRNPVAEVVTDESGSFQAAHSVGYSKVVVVVQSIALCEPYSDEPPRARSYRNTLRPERS